MTGPPCDTAEPGTPDHDAMLLLDLTAPRTAANPSEQSRSE
ncbi:hypothetical protein [Streptomyces sp. NPDC020917]